MLKISLDCGKHIHVSSKYQAFNSLLNHFNIIYFNSLLNNFMKYRMIINFFSSDFAMKIYLWKSFLSKRSWQNGRYQLAWMHRRVNVTLRCVLSLLESDILPKTERQSICGGAVRRSQIYMRRDCSLKKFFLNKILFSNLSFYTLFVKINLEFNEKKNKNHNFAFKNSLYHFYNTISSEYWEHNLKFQIFIEFGPERKTFSTWIIA